MFESQEFLMVPLPIQRLQDGSIDLKTLAAVLRETALELERPGIAPLLADMHDAPEMTQ